MAIPKGWNLQSLSQDVELRSGQHLLADEWHHEPIGVPYLTGPADFPNGHIVITKYTEHPKVMCSAGDVLITVKGSGCGRLARVSSAACISRQLMAIRPCTWNSDFIFQVLTASSQLLADQASGLIPGLTREQLLNLQFPIPPLPEQKKIAAVLSSVDAAIEKTEAVIAQLQVVKKAMMEQLLTKGMPGRHTRFKQTDLGEIPEEWEVVKIGDVGDVHAGRQRNPSAVGELRPYLRVANVFDGRVDVRDVLEMPFTETEFCRFELKVGDVLLNEGQSLELVGRCSVYSGEFPEPCAFQNTLIRFRPGPKTGSAFATQLFRWMQISGAFAAVATQTTSIAHLGVSRFAGMKIRLPPPLEQSEIAAALCSADESMACTRAELRAIRAVKSSLSSSLLSGELRVTTDSVPCPV